MQLWICVTLSALGCAVGLAQGQPEALPKYEQPVAFEWLRQFEGEWKTDFNGVMKSRVIGQRWVINEISFQAGVHSIQTIGYDKRKKEFVGTWVDATSAYIWRYTGSLDARGRTLVLEAEGPDMNDPAKLRRYRDSYEFKSKNEIYAVSQMLGDGGNWNTFSKGSMIRKGS